MASSLLHLARWLAWQVVGADDLGPERPASITVFSGPEAVGEEPPPS